MRSEQIMDIFSLIIFKMFSSFLFFFFLIKCANLWKLALTYDFVLIKLKPPLNSAMATGLEISVFAPIPKKGNFKECPNYQKFVLISHAYNIMLKIHQASHQQYVNQELPDHKLGFEVAEEPEIKLPTSFGS